MIVTPQAWTDNGMQSLTSRISPLLNYDTGIFYKGSFTPATDSGHTTSRKWSLFSKSDYFEPVVRPVAKLLHQSGARRNRTSVYADTYFTWWCNCERVVTGQSHSLQVWELVSFSHVLFGSHKWLHNLLKSPVQLSLNILHYLKSQNCISLFTTIPWTVFSVFTVIFSIFFRIEIISDITS